MKKPIPFGKYYLLDRISVGGMAEVFKAKTFGVEGFERLLAVKRILPSIAEDEEFITMFIDEAKIAVQLQHANIAQIFDLGKVGDSYFIALEYVSGTDLRTIFDRMRKTGQALPIPMAVYAIMKTCEGLDYAHRKKDAANRDLNLVHRDVSPQNLLVSFDGEVKIIDFGIAKAAGKAGKTQAGILKGKFGYMSPEQVRGLPLDSRSDIFAVGICLWELLTGERLFVGESDFSTLEKVRNVEINPPSMYNKRIPDDLEKIILKTLSRETEDRYQSAMDLHDDLQSWMYTSGSFFARKDLAAFMQEVFRAEIEKETTSVTGGAALGRSTVPPPPRTGSSSRPKANRASVPPPPPRAKQTLPPPAPGRRPGQPPMAAQPFDARTTKPALPMVPGAAGGAPKMPGPPGPGRPGAPKRTMLGVPAVVPPPARPAPPTKPAASASLSQSTEPRVDPAAVAPPPMQDGGIGMDDWDEEEPPTNIYSKETAAAMAQAAVANETNKEVVAAPGAQGASAPMDIPTGSGFRPSAAPAMSFDEPQVQKSKKSLMPLFVGLGAAVVVLGIVFVVFLLLGKSPGSLQLNVEPGDNLNVIVDGAKTLPGTKSPFIIPDLSKGPHVVTVQRSGYKEQQVKVLIESGEVAEKLVSLEKAATGFFLETDPPGATVLVDNRPIDEKTPVTVSDLEAGTHLIRLTKGDAFAPMNIEVEIAEGEIAEIPKKTLQLKAVEVTFETSPKGAKVVLINEGKEEDLGATPVTKIIDTRKDYKVRFTLDGYKDVQKLVDPAAGKEKITISETLLAAPRTKPTVATRPTDRPTTNRPTSSSKKTGTLSVQTKPWSKVYINGKFIKNTPLVNHTLRVGQYQVTVENPNFNIKKNYRVTIRSGKRTTLLKNIVL